MKLINALVLILSIVIVVESNVRPWWQRRMAKAGRDNVAGLKCAENEIVDSCGSCEGTCNDGDFVSCAFVCSPPACVCRRGLYRSLTGKCMTPEECSKSEIDLNRCRKIRGPNSKIANQVTCSSKMCLPDNTIVRRRIYNEDDLCQNYPGCVCKNGFIIYNDRTCHEDSKCQQFSID